MRQIAERLAQLVFLRQRIDVGQASGAAGDRGAEKDSGAEAVAQGSAVRWRQCGRLWRGPRMSWKPKEFRDSGTATGVVRTPGW